MKFNINIIICTLVLIILPDLYLNQVINMTTSDCGSKYGCFVSPSSCLSNDCEFIIKWADLGDKVEFKLYRSRIGTAGLWLALGFSADRTMVNDSVIICGTNGSWTFVEHYYTIGHVTPILFSEQNRSIGLSDQTYQLTDTVAMCSFKRSKVLNMLYYNKLTLNSYLITAVGIYNNVLNKHYAKMVSPYRFNYSTMSTNLQSTGDCGSGYGCFKVPSTCQQPIDCQYFVKWKTVGQKIQFSISTQTNLIYNQYLSIGFSNDNQMGDDSMVMCIISDTNGYKIESYYSDYRILSNLDPTNKTFGLSDMQVTLYQSLFTCTFSRDIKASNNNSKFFDLTNGHFLLVSKGTTLAGDVPFYHGINRISSEMAIDFTSSQVIVQNSNLKFLRLHGILMVFAWNFLSTNGVLFSRYYRYFNRRRKFCGVKFWFIMHGPMMLLVITLTIVSFFLVLTFKNWTWTSISARLNFVHSIFGIITVSLASIQITALIRPNKDHPKRYLFTIIHRTVGSLAYILSLFSMTIGFLLYFNYEYLYVLIVWVSWVLFYTLSLELIDRYLRAHGGTKEEIAIDRYKARYLKTTLFFISFFASCAFFAIFVILILHN